MNIKLILLLCLFTWTIVKGQEVKDFYPTTYPIDLSAAGEKKFIEGQKKCNEIWEKLSKGVTEKDLTKEDQNILMNCDETESESGYWNIDKGGCSWYCGGGPKKITSSSYLISHGKIDYKPENAHDLNYQTAWVEGKKGYGEGEYLTYHFAYDSPRINKIIVVNGYVKSLKSWKENSRVKTLKMYLNDKEYAFLHLKDERSEQSFKIEPIGNAPEIRSTLAKNDWTIKFEIVDVYKGDLYDDVVLSEIYFDGLDVHCLAKGTLISISNTDQKKIEDLKEGDTILSLNRINGKLEKSKILKLANANHVEMIEIALTNGRKIVTTYDHPILSENGNWLSYEPKKTMSDYQINNVNELKTGCIIKIRNGVGRVESIKKIRNKLPTYTIVMLDRNDTFIANGIVVGIEKLREKTFVQHTTISH